ncbi:PQQ-binding-like beta-propeller repeat protein [candidate division KSB1 bacterium]|nr:PQQ-binding-like beta-propeller repeat protein [candidate division KSB1 bacterium]
MRNNRTVLLFIFCYYLFSGSLLPEEILWKSNIDRHLTKFLKLFKDTNEIIALDKNNNLVCFDTQNGQEKWKCTLKAELVGLYLLDDKVYCVVGKEEKNVCYYAIKYDSAMLTLDKLFEYPAKLDKEWLIDNYSAVIFYPYFGQAFLFDYEIAENILILSASQGYPYVNNFITVAIDLASDSLLWTHELKPYKNKITYYYNDLYSFVSGNSFIDVSDVYTHNVLSLWPVNNVITPNLLYNNVNKNLYIKNPKNIISIDIKTGKGKWMSRDFDSIINVQFINLNNHYDKIIIETEACIQCLNNETGDLLWSQKKPLSGRCYNTTLVVDNYLLYFGEKIIKAINLIDGQQLWDFKNKRCFSTSPIIDKDKITLIDENNLVLIDRYSGQIITKLLLYSSHDSGNREYLLSTPKFYIYRESKELVAINKNTIQISWRNQLKNDALPVWVKENPFRLYYSDGKDFFVLDEHGNKEFNMKLHDKQDRQNRIITTTLDVENDILYELSNDAMIAYSLND